MESNHWNGRAPCLIIGCSARTCHLRTNKLYYVICLLWMWCLFLIKHIHPLFLYTKHNTNKYYGILKVQYIKMILYITDLWRVIIESYVSSKILVIQFGLSKSCPWFLKCKATCTNYFLYSPRFKKTSNCYVYITLGIWFVCL